MESKGEGEEARARYEGKSERLDGRQCREEEEEEEVDSGNVATAGSSSDPAHNNNQPSLVGFSVGGRVGASSVAAGAGPGSKAGSSPVSLSQILHRSGGGGGGVPHSGSAVGVGSESGLLSPGRQAERVASHSPVALVPSHHSHLYQYKAHQPNFTSSIAGVRIMGHGASCLTGSAAPASSSSTNNCSVSSFTPLQRNQPTQQKAGAASSSTTTTANIQQQHSAGMNNSATTTATAAAAVVKHVPDDYQYLCNLVPELKTELKERESRLDLYQTETLELKRRLKKRDEEIGRLQREIHKLKVSPTN